MRFSEIVLGLRQVDLLRLVAGLEEVTEGRIFIEGRDVTLIERKVHYR